MSFYILIYFKMQFIPVIAKLNDSSEIIQICSWFAAQDFFLIIINVENSFAAQYFCGNRDALYIFFRILWLID